MEKGLPNKLVDKVVEKRKSGKGHADKRLSEKAKSGIGKGDKPTQKSAAKGEENRKSSKQIAAKNAPRKDLQILQEELALKFEEGASKKRTYQKEFITRLTMCSFSSVLAQLNEAQAKAARSIGLASFLKIDLKQIPGKFFKWLVESNHPYAVCFMLLDG
ncbi:hypothetical protein Cgig2_006239 [Carnegiea gigantea]|uniref:Uncharacterized protein n=1 Tax=Carnegiea gigantea TaxID=171969 RepID=A0A9Q1GR81_9CARY|nr:hypothetical protein Cgig2_006239 [Carnegiea gigantea]